MQRLFNKREEEEKDRERERERERKKERERMESRKYFAIVKTKECVTLVNR